MDLVYRHPDLREGIGGGDLMLMVHDNWLVHFQGGEVRLVVPEPDLETVVRVLRLTGYDTIHLEKEEKPQPVPVGE